MIDQYLTVQGMKELGQFLGMKLDELKRVNKMEMDMRPMENMMEEDHRLMARLIMRLETALGRIKEPKFTGQVKVDTSTFNKELQNIVSEIKDLGEGLVQRMPDNSALERGLKMLLEKEQDNSKILSALSDLKTIIDKKLNIPSTIKIDDNQFRELSGTARYGGGGVIGLGGSGALQGRRITINNTTLTLANTEYNYAFPATTVAWVVKTRAQNVKLLYAWGTGTLPTSGDGSAYMTVPQNFLRSQDNVDYANKTIYLQADVAGTIVEIESYQS